MNHTRRHARRFALLAVVMLPLRRAAVLPEEPDHGVELIRRRPKSGTRPWRQRRGNGWYHQYFHNGGRKT